MDLKVKKAHKDNRAEVLGLLSEVEELSRGSGSLEGGIMVQQKLSQLRDLIEERKRPVRWRNGDLICKTLGSHDGWWTHPEGIVFKRGNQFLLNGLELLYSGPYDGYEASILAEGGVIIQQDNQFWLNGKTLLWEGEWDTWDTHPVGIITVKDKEFRVNGEIVYNGEWEEWRAHAKGVVIKRGIRLLLNGTELLYEGIFDDWKWHPQGVLISRGNELLLNGGRSLYKGSWTDWHSHSQGVIIQIGNKILINGRRLLYQGVWNAWDVHPQGVIVEKESEWRIYTGGSNTVY